ncbi:phosphatase PAP2 family protein [Nocardioides sp.]|uniref:phosphatase PAP2 family protein n=1 Tax=Nocardioides sp. TaxID=35761 RepID=UPI00286E039B|nr:phosphatase PAP2 family protein [Nocardioides sp.]
MSAPELRPRTGEVLPREQEGYWWVARVWLLVVLFAMVTAAGSHHYGIPVRDPHGAWLPWRMAISVGLFALLSLVDAGRRAGRPGWTLRRTLEVLRSRWTRGRLALAMTGLLAYHLVYFCYHNLKSWNVFNEPRDDMLQQWDRWLFLGHSPAVLLHDVLGQHVAAYVLTLIYVSFSSVLSASFVAALVFTDRVRHGYVFITSAMWVWILGVGAYYLIPSLGPFSYAPEEFAGLSHTRTQDTQARYLTQRADLLAQPQAHDATAQIAAFASLHVAIVLMILLMARYYRLDRAAQAMTVYLAGTMVATVYLGWHFAVDLIGGFVVAYAAVFLGRWMVYPRRARRSQA